MPTVRITLLGELSAVSDHASVRAADVRGRQGRLALAFLAVHRDRAVPRAELAEALWELDLPIAWDDQLNTIVSRVRSALSKLGADAPTIERAQSGAYRLLAPGASVDWHEALATVARADRPHPDELLLGELREAISSLSLPLLPGEQAHWIEQLRQRQRSTLLRAYEISVSLSRLDSPAMAIELCERALELDPFRETLYQELIRLHLARGDRAAAVQVHARCRKVLRDELGVSPSPQTEAVFVEALRESARAEGPPAPAPIPRPLSSFVGRQQEMRRLLVALSSSRLVTLTGFTGIGKTRMALEALAALEKDRPVAFADLNGEADPVQAIARAVRAARDDLRLDELVRDIADQPMVLVLDGCELVDAVAPVVETLLQRCPGLTALCTGPQPLRVAGETHWRVGPLTFADEVSDPRKLALQESVQLFVSRARDADPTFDPTDDDVVAIGRICAVLEGVPLQIEMAAARVRAMKPHEIASRMDHLFALLQTGARTADPRHRTLRAMMDWTHNQLEQPERVVFRRLGVFEGSFDAHAAEAVCVGDDVDAAAVMPAVATLVDRSVLTATKSGKVTRYSVPRAVRMYAMERLTEAGEVDSTFGRLFGWARALFPARAGLDEERATVRSLVDWLGASGRDVVGVDEAVRFVIAYTVYLEFRHAIRESRQHLEATMSWDGLPAALATRVRDRLAKMCHMLQDVDAMEQHLRILLDGAIAEGRAIDAGRWETMLGVACTMRQRPADAAGWFDAALRRVESLDVEPIERVRAIPAKTNSLLALGEYAAARACIERYLPVVERHRHRMWWIVPGLANVCELALAEGRLSEAEHAISECLAAAHETADPSALSWSLRTMAEVRFAGGDVTGAFAFFEQAAALRDLYEDKSETLSTLRAYARAALLAGDPDRAVSLYEDARSLVEPHVPAARQQEEVAKLSALVAVARALAGEVEDARAAVGDLAPLLHDDDPERLVPAGDVLRLAGESERAAETYARAASFAAGRGMRPRLAFVNLRLGDLRAATGQAEEARASYLGALKEYRGMSARPGMIRAIERIGLLPGGAASLAVASRARRDLGTPAKPLFRAAVSVAQVEEDAAADLDEHVRDLLA